MATVFPAGSGQPLEEVAELLHRVNRRLRRRASEQLSGLGLTPAQARALRTLGRAGGPIRMSALAAQLGIARRSATSVVDELAGSGLVERQADPTDRRARAVVLTGPGAAVLRRLSELRHHALAELAAGWRAEDLERLRRALVRLDAAAQDRA